MVAFFGIVTIVSVYLPRLYLCFIIVVLLDCFALIVYVVVSDCSFVLCLLAFVYLFVIWAFLLCVLVVDCLLVICWRLFSSSSGHRSFISIATIRFACALTDACWFNFCVCVCLCF